jgi:hypothetical protein
LRCSQGTKLGNLDDYFRQAVEQRIHFDVEAAGLALRQFERLGLVALHTYALGLQHVAASLGREKRILSVAVTEYGGNRRS